MLASRALPALLLASVATQGCAARIASTRGSEYTVQARLENAGQATYELHDQAGTTIDRARASGGEVTFELPRKNAAGSEGGRFYVDRKRDGMDVTLPGPGTGPDAYVIDHPAWRAATACDALLSSPSTSLKRPEIEATCGDVASWVRAKEAALAVVRARDERDRAERAARREFDSFVTPARSTLASAERRLSEHRMALRSSAAWRGGQCVLPATGSLPERPWRACEPRDAKPWAAGVCVTTMVGAEFTPDVAAAAIEDAAGRALTEGESAMLTLAASPAASAAAAAAQGRDYGLAELGSDLSWTAADWAASQAMKSEYWWVRALGGAGKTITFAKKLAEAKECYEAVQEVCVDTWDTWQADLKRVRGAPGLALSECATNAAAVPTLEAALPALRRDVATAERKAAPTLSELEAREAAWQEARAALRAALSRPQSSRTSALREGSDRGMKGMYTASDNARGAVGSAAMDVEFALEDLFDPGYGEQDAWNGGGIGIGWFHNDFSPDGWAVPISEFAPQDGVAVEAYVNFIPGRVVIGYHESGAGTVGLTGPLSAELDGETMESAGSEALTVRRVTMGADLLPAAPFNEVISPYVGAAAAWHEFVVAAEFGDGDPQVASTSAAGFAPELRAGAVVVAAPSWLLLDARGTFTPLPGGVTDLSIVVTANIRLFKGD